MPRNAMRIEPYTGTPPASWARSIGPPPYFCLQEEYTEEGYRNWETVLYLSRTDLSQLFKNIGVILVKVHDEAPAQQ